MLLSHKGSQLLENNIVAYLIVPKFSEANFFVAYFIVP